MTPTFQGEVQFRRYSDTSTQGQQVVFAVADREALESFVGKEGKRFMAVLVEIGDDEQPVSPNPEKPRKDREMLGDLCYRAVQWCNEPEFFEWIRPVYDKAMGGDGSGTGDIEIGGHLTAQSLFCKHAILVLCDVNSRKELDTPNGAWMFKKEIVEPYAEFLRERERLAA